MYGYSGGGKLRQRFFHDKFNFRGNKMVNNDEMVLNMYLKEINRIPLLTRDEEIELAKKAAAGDKRAREKIVNANLRFVVNVAKKYQNHGIETRECKRRRI